MGGSWDAISGALSILARWTHCGFDWISLSCLSFLTVCDWGAYLLTSLNSSAQPDNGNKPVKREHTYGTQQRMSAHIVDDWQAWRSHHHLLTHPPSASPLPTHCRNSLLALFSFASLLFSPLCLQQINPGCIYTRFKRHTLNLKLLIICSWERHCRSVPIIPFVFCRAILDEWISKCPESLKTNTEIQASKEHGRRGTIAKEGGRMDGETLTPLTSLVGATSSLFESTITVLVWTKTLYLHIKSLDSPGGF